MVKNKFGGNRHKKMARKNVHTGPIQRKTRYSTHPDEIYACCNQIFGGGQIKVVCLDSTEMLCFIRNKFRGRGKRGNVVNIGTWILVGRREFETTNKKLEKCDLLEVYSEYDKKNLEQNVTSVNWQQFKYIGQVEEIVEDDLNIEFTNNIPDEETVISTQDIIEEDEVIIKLNPNDLMGEIGFGMDFYLEFFKFSPQIKISAGILNLLDKDQTVYTTSIKNLYTNGWMLSFTFE